MDMDMDTYPDRWSQSTIIIVDCDPPASSLDEGETVEDSHGQSHYAQRKDGQRDSDLLDSRIE